MKDDRTERLQVLVTQAEKALFERAAKEVGISMSSWLRTVGLASARKIVIDTKDGTRPTV